MIIAVNLIYFQYFDNPGDNEELEEFVIDHGENSIYTGYYPFEIAESLAIAINVTPIISKEQETHGGVAQFTYNYQSDTKIQIITDRTSKSLWKVKGSYIDIFSKKNITIGKLNASEIAFKFCERFFNDLGYKFIVNDYTINISKYDWGCKIRIRQICNDNLILTNTGLSMDLKSDYTLESINFYEWSKEKINKNISISLTESTNIIYKEIQDVQINKSMLNFTGYSYFSDNVFYHFVYKVKDTNVTHRIIGIVTPLDDTGYRIENITAENLTLMFDKWIGFNIYINIENGELIYKKYGITKDIYYL
jgi:hypothetical protein